MPLPTRTLRQFQEWVWAELPAAEKQKVGKEAVYDAVSAAIQEWPDTVLSESKAGDLAESRAAMNLGKSVNRHMTLMYGDKNCGTVWIIALQILLPLIVDLILKWWRRRKEHQARLRMWRRKWVNGTET